MSRAQDKANKVLGEEAAREGAPFLFLYVRRKGKIILRAVGPAQGRRHAAVREAFIEEETPRNSEEGKERPGLLACTAEEGVTYKSGRKKTYGERFGYLREDVGCGGHCRALGGKGGSSRGRLHR